jgi:hypothetical protein
VVRPCAWAALGEDGSWLDSGWLPHGAPPEIARALRRTVDAHAGGDASRVAVGIDAPRMPLPAPRAAYWSRSKSSWRRRSASDRGYGRHCEVVVAAYRLGNPQWTPLAGEAPAWMQLGFALFEALAGVAQVHEVFPSASYAQLAGADSVSFELRLCEFAHGPKDMLDAHVAAATVREFAQGRGQAVGGGDGLGAIALARPLPAGPEAVLRWPDF